MPTNILIEKMPRLIVLLLFCGSIHNVLADNPAYGTESEIKLKQVDLPKDTILYDIVKREISNTHSSKEKVKFYSVYLSDYEDGTMVTSQMALPPRVAATLNRKHPGRFSSASF